jgi:hypothetical protein
VTVSPAPRPVRRPLVLAAAALLLASAAAAAPREASANDNLRVELRPVAAKVARFLQSEQTDRVAVGAVKEGGQIPLASSGGPGIQQALCEELALAKVRVVDRDAASYVILGDYAPVRRAETGSVVLLLSFKLLDPQGAAVLEGDRDLTRGLYGDASISSLAGLNYAPPVGGDRSARDAAIEKAVQHPATEATQATVRAERGSPYGVEVHVKQGGRYVPQPVRTQDGRAFAPVDRGSSYGVALVNDSPHDALVTLTIDGINMFQFSRLPYRQVLVPARDRVLVRGWHVDNRTSEEFLVTSYAKSAAASVRSTAGLGTITAAFSAAWAPDAPPPSDEPPSPHEHSRDASGTGRGVKIGQTYVEEVRRSGVVRACVTIRYAKE